MRNDSKGGMPNVRVGVGVLVKDPNNKGMVSKLSV